MYTVLLGHVRAVEKQRVLDNLSVSVCVCVCV